jgi:hypothetical protein
MKTPTFVFLTTLLAISAGVSAQDYAFKVLASKGKNEVKSGAAWESLKTGATLNSSDELKLSDNAYIGLVHSSGKPFEVKEAGLYKISDLEKRVPAGSSVLNKYTDFILSSNSSGATNRLSATGAVHRDLNTAGPAAIKLHLPGTDHAWIFNNTSIVSWEASGAGPYVITVKNMFEDVLEKAETPENSFKIDLGNKKYVRENAVLIEVSSKADPKLVSKRHMIKKLSPAEAEKISAALQQIKTDVSEETAVNKLILAGFYENNNLLIDAISAYEQALQLEPEAYGEMYEAFLLRNHLK